MKKFEGVNAKALELREIVNRLRRRQEKLNKEINNKIEEMHVACVHDDIEINDSYVEGGYLDRCQYIKTYICKICRKELKQDITYGGFN
jgi:hypothetical protein